MNNVIHGSYDFIQLVRMAVMCKVALAQNKTLIFETTARMTNDPQRGNVSASAELLQRFLAKYKLPAMRTVGYLNRDIPTAVMVGEMDKNAIVEFLHNYETQFADQAALKITKDLDIDQKLINKMYPEEEEIKEA